MRCCTWKTASFCFLRNLCMRRRLRKGGDSINSFMAWVGGKKALRDEILARFPRNYKRYIEVFGGAGWVLFHKPPGNDFEVFNDFNGNLVNLYRCVREQPEALRNELRYMLNSRLDFEYMKGMLHSRAVLPDVRRAAYYYALIRYSYAAGTSTFGSQPHAMWNNFPLIESAAGRLQKVVIENKDCVKLIRQYDRPESFFYCDPPYFEAEKLYEVGFPREKHIELKRILAECVGFIVVSYNDCPFIRCLYEDFYILAFRRNNPLSQKKNATYGELIITNYDPRSYLQPQVSMFPAEIENGDLVLVQKPACGSLREINLARREKELGH